MPIPPPPPPELIPPQAPLPGQPRTVCNADGSRWQWEHGYFRYRYVSAVTPLKGWKGVVAWVVILLVLAVCVWGFVKLRNAGFFGNSPQPPADQPHEPDQDPYFP